MVDWNQIGMSWTLVLPPSRPEALELARIRAIATKLDRTEAVAVLGSTPEFRDLLAELSFENVTVLDKNPKFYQAMSEYRIYRNRETLVEGDWMDTLSGHADHFSLILSDLTSGNVPYAGRPQFYEQIHNALVPGGYFVDKNLTNESPAVTVEEIKSKYITLPLNLQTVNYFSCEAIFCSTIPEELGVVETSEIYRILDESLDDMRTLSPDARGANDNTAWVLVVLW